MEKVMLMMSPPRKGRIPSNVKPESKVRHNARKQLEIQA
jgi:hypothetical protein